MVVGDNCQLIAEQARSIAVVNEVFIADHSIYQHPLAETLAPLIVHIAKKNISHILAPATTFGKNFLPRVAALLQVAQISDIIAVLDASTYCRPIYAGNAIAKVRSLDSIQVITVRPTAFVPIEMSSNSLAPLSVVDLVVTQDQSHFIAAEGHQTTRPDLGTAEVVVAGGRGLGDKSQFERLAGIADRLHAALGASRAAVDAGLAPNDWQVGQTGKIVSPKLYIAVGISGAIQHLAGMKDSQVIVAINKDPDAPIFQIADYGLVGDIGSILPEWEKILDNLERSK